MKSYFFFALNFYFMVKNQANQDRCVGYNNLLNAVDITVNDFFLIKIQPTQPTREIVQNPG